MTLDLIAAWITQPGPALLWAALGFLLGALVGHYLSIGRDKRREFNAIADPVRIELRRQSRAVHPMNSSSLDFDSIEDQLRWCKRAGFRRAVKKYKAARQQHYLVDSQLGSIDGYTRTDHIEYAIKNLIRRMRRR
jgi:hypothetical protein